MGLSALIGFNGLFPFSCWGSFLLQKFFQTLSFFLLPLRPLYSNTDAFNIVPEVSEAILNSFHSFPFILLFSSYFHNSIFQLTLYVLLSHSTVDSFESIFNFSNCVIHPFFWYSLFILGPHYLCLLILTFSPFYF